MADDDQTTPDPDAEPEAQAESEPEADSAPASDPSEVTADEPQPAAEADPAAEAESAVESASEAAESLAEQAADPAAPVDEEIDEQTAAALKAAQDAIAAVKSGVAPEPAENGQPAQAPTVADGAAAFEPPPLTAGPARAAPAEVRLLSDVNLNVKIELGRTRMVVEDVLKLGEGAVVELDKAAGDPVDIYVNDRRVARGEVLVINDCFCVRVSEIVASSDAA